MDSLVQVAQAAVELVKAVEGKEVRIHDGLHHYGLVELDRLSEVVNSSIEDLCRRCGKPVGTDPFNYCTSCCKGPFCPACWPRHAAQRATEGCNVIEQVNLPT